jgi:putative transcriptional regulator
LRKIPAGFYFDMRDLRGGPHRSLAGSFLAAHPNMLDPNFRRSVLFISSHGPQDGAVGLIINRPLDKSVSDLVNELPPHGLADVPVFAGGPVGKNQLVFAAFEWKQGQGLKVDHAVDVDEASQRAESDPASVRAFVGYAGWSAGQLEAEMKQQAWIVHKPTRSAMKPESLPKLWFNIMRSLGPWFKMLALAPDDPSLN